MGSCCSSHSAPPHSPLPQVSGLLERLVCAKKSSYCSSSCTQRTCSWRPLKCVLDGRFLSYYELDDSVRSEKTLRIDRNFQLRSERVHLLEIRIRLVNEKTGKIEKWKLRAHTPASFVAWSTSLKRATRPERIESEICFECGKRFSMLNSPVYCKSCGHAVCSSCSSRSALLPHLGYSHQQRICHSCFSRPFSKQSKTNSTMATGVM